MSNELAIAMFLAGLVVGALAAKQVEAPPWQGAVVMLAGGALSFIVMAFAQVEGAIWPFLLSAVGAGIVGGAMKLTARQIVAIYLIATAGQFVVAHLWLQSGNA